MNVLLNFATLKKGGGQNVALNFISSLHLLEKTNDRFYYAVVENSSLHNALKHNGFSGIITMPGNPLKRMIMELFKGNKIVKDNNIDIIYTYFGIGLYPKRIPQVSGSADSNIFFPEIDFWINYKGIKKLLKKLIDEYRIWGLKRAKAVVFENQLMEERGRKIFKLQNTVFIKPSISVAAEREVFQLPANCRGEKYKGLFFCGWQRNKNFMLIPAIANEFKKNNIDFHFLITAAEDHSIDHLDFMAEVNKYNVQDRISIIGTVNKTQIVSLFEQIDFVFLLSKLESFSNNIIEAWYFNRILVIADELWSRSICGNAALYVNRNNEKDIYAKIQEVILDEKKYDTLLKNGQHMITEYPTINERTKQEIDYIKHIYASN